MTLDMDVPPGMGAARLGLRHRSLPDPVRTERCDLKVCGFIPRDLHGVYLYGAASEPGETVFRIRLQDGRLRWSEAHWGEQASTMLDESRDGETVRSGPFTFMPLVLEAWDDLEAVPTRLARCDLDHGGRIERDFGEAALVSSFTYVPKWDGAPDGDGWLLGFVHDGGHGVSAFYVLDAVTLGTQAKIAVPAAMANGVSGLWVASEG